MFAIASSQRGRMKMFAAVAIFTPMGLMAQAPESAPPADVVIKNATVMTVTHGTIDHGSVWLHNGKIAEMARTRQLKLPVWKNYLIPFESVLEPEDVHLSAQIAYTNMIRVGTTCFAEAGGPHPDQMGEAALEVGIRGFIALSTMDQSEAIGATVPSSMMMKPSVSTS